MNQSKTKIESLTGLLGSAYDSWKDFEEIKNEIKREFFEFAEDQYESVAERVVSHVLADDIDEAQYWIEKSNPFWRTSSIRLMEDEENQYEAVLVERSDLKPFAYENEEDGRTYRKQVSAGSVYLDDDRLAKFAPDLFEEISYDTPWGDKILMPLEYMTDDQMADVSEYIYEGKPTVKLTVSKPK